MSSRYTEAFDSLKSDDNTKQERAERILFRQSAGVEQRTKQTGAASEAKARRRIFPVKRGVALLTAAAVSITALAIFIPAAINLRGGGLLKSISLLEDTFVDMDGVAAFGVWNAPESSDESASVSACVSSLAYVRTPLNAATDNTTDDATAPTDGSGDILTGDWSDDDRYDWESDYDWDPTKANVLISIDEEGKISEVVYERVNGRGQIRQDSLGNAAAVYVSNGFTYVMYVDDREWEFWKEINFAQEMHSPSGFHCHHESMQTVVIHNETGKVFALKDLIPQVNELSGATNYTMQVVPFRDDLLYVQPMYGNYIPQWYNVIYDEELQKIRYELVLPADCPAIESYSYNVRAVRRDIYGQQYLLEGSTVSNPRVTAGIVQLPPYTLYGNSLVFSTANGMMFGTDGRMYVFDGDKLKVFGENFSLHPVEPGTQAAFVGVADDFQGRASSVNDGIVYKLEGGYLYSMFGEVWDVDEEGAMHPRGNLEGAFPRYADDGYLLGGEIIAFVDTSEIYNASVNGEMVQIRFDRTDDTPRAVITHIIDASQMSVFNGRMVVEQTDKPYSLERGESKYFLITVQDGTPSFEYFAYGSGGGVTGLTKPITEPLVLS